MLKKYPRQKHTFHFLVSNLEDNISEKAACTLLPHNSLQWRREQLVCFSCILLFLSVSVLMSRFSVSTYVLAELQCILVLILLVHFEVDSPNEESTPGLLRIAQFGYGTFAV